MSDGLPKALARAGIKSYRSNLLPGQQVLLPASTFFTLFKDEVMKQLTTFDDADDKGHGSAEAKAKR